MISPFQTLNSSLIMFALAVVVIGIFGVRMTRVARAIAADSGIGEAIIGAFFIGATTSLSGIVASMTAAAHGHAELAVSNSLGGIAAQTVFLALADAAYRKANLEHAAASAENLMLTALVLMLLTIALIGFVLPDWAIWSVHPVSVALIAAYLFGLRILGLTHSMPMWKPRQTRDTRPDESTGSRRRRPLPWTRWAEFGIYGLLVGVAGWVLSRSAIVIAAATGLAEGFVGGVFTAVSSSLPELVIAISAVRMKSLTLALGDIVGGNAFDTLFLSMSDLAYREGPIYAAVTQTSLFWLAVTLLMMSVLMVGLLHRERRGIAGIGMESFLILVIYLASMAIVGI